MTRLLIVNADDFGLTPAVSRGILRGHRDGIVTSTSALVVAPGFSESARLLREAPALGVGVHLAAVGEDPPLSPASRIASLVGAGGRFPRDWKAFLMRSPRVRSADLEAEFAAQIEEASSAGLSIDHLDTHQHLHLLPAVRAVVLRLAKRFRIPAIRVPRAGLRRPAGIAVRWLSRGLAREAAREGVAFPRRFEGFDQSGRMGLAPLLVALSKLARTRAATAEISIHPGEREDSDRGRYAWGYDWPAELAALVAPEARDAVARAGFRLGTFRDLPLPGAAP